MTTVPLLLFGIALCTVIWIAVTRPTLALYGAIFLIPWEGLDADFGLRVTAYQVVLAVILMTSFPRFFVEERQFSALPGAYGLALFLGYAILWSLLQLPFLPDADVIGGALRGPAARSLVQMMLLVFTVSPVFLVPMILPRGEGIVNAAKVYLYSVSILAAVGWCQLAIWYATGTNPLPIGLVNNWLGGTIYVGDVLRSGEYEFGVLPIYRMNALGGEPKTLGAAFVFGMLVIQAFLATAKAKRPRTLMACWLLLALSVVATLSTTALFLWPIGTAGLILAQRLLRGNRATVSGKSVSALFLLVVVIVLVGVGAEAAGIPIVDLLLDRTVQRVAESSSGVLEDFDDAIVRYLLEHPFYTISGVGLGNIHLYANSYLDPGVAVYAGGGVFVAKAQYLRFISEVGVLGLGLFISWYWRLLRSFGCALTSARAAAFGYLSALPPFAVVSLLAFLAAGSLVNQFYVTAGVIVAGCLTLGRQKN